MNGVVVWSGLVLAVWSQDCDGKVNMIAAEATVGVVVLSTD